jgi:integrase
MMRGLPREVTPTLEALEALQLNRHVEAVTGGREPSPWVFCDAHSKPSHQNWIRSRFFKLLKAAGIRQVRFHDIRHTVASLLLQNGESSVSVKDQAGHSLIQVTVGR